MGILTLRVQKFSNPKGLYPTSKTMVKDSSKICAQTRSQIDQGNGKMMKLPSNLNEQGKATIILL